MKRMTQNTRPIPGPSAARDGGNRRRSRKRRGGPNAAAGKQGEGKPQGKSRESKPSEPQKKAQQDKAHNKPQENKAQQNKPHNKPENKSNNKRRRRRGGQNRRGQNQRGRNNRNSQRRSPQYADRHDSSIETRDETSAGGLVVSGMAEAVDKNGHVDMSRIYVALIGRLDRRGRLLWSMPKGHVEDGEHQWRTAEREVWEETGIVGEAFDTLGVIDYWFVSDGVRIHKTVHHNLLRYVDGVLNDEDPEVTEVAWVPVSELIEHLAYADERKLARIAFDKMPEYARAEKEAGRITPR